MSKKIIVAGGGHGGIACGALLARVGYDVTVYEKNKREDMGYDWTDIFDPKALELAGVPFPEEGKYEYKTNMTFIPPSGNVKVTQDVPKDQLEIKMERKDIYDLLISNAEKSGVKFVYECNILGPITKGDRVIGIKTDKEDIEGDMVIDACGCNSPVRANLPECCGIQKCANDFERFFVYRAFYNKTDAQDNEDKYKVYLLPEGRLGIGWVASEENYTDLLIGEFSPFTKDEAKIKADFFRNDNPILGNKVKRGGQMVQIPVRQPLSIMVADGYAAIGDSAFMTVPIIGSGIANSLKAASFLAQAIRLDYTQTFSAETLWDYQVKYYKELGNGMAPLALVKLMLTKISPDQLDYLFEKGILTTSELTITADSTSLLDFIKIDTSLIHRGLDLFKNKELTKMILKVGADIGKTFAICETMPKRYSRHSVQSWAKAYDNIFKF